MERLVHLGNIEQDRLSYSSLNLFNATKSSHLKLTIVEFTFLNSRLQRVNIAFCFIMNNFATLGSSKCKCLSELDLNDAYHTSRLSDSSKVFSGIVPYFGSISYVYKGLPMGLSLRPSIWPPYVNAILISIHERPKYVAIMDDQPLHISKRGHLKYPKDLLKALPESGLKILPKKC